jgi:hypothetical protein
MDLVIQHLQVIVRILTHMCGRAHNYLFKCLWFVTQSLYSNRVLTFVLFTGKVILRF